MAYTPAQIAQATGCLLEHAQATWPATLAALTWVGINDHATRIAVAATIATETYVTVKGVNMTFMPVAEIDGWNQPYAPWFGRGTYQCTGYGNYAEYGPRMSPAVNLIADPDLLLQQVPSAQFAALYSDDNHVRELANAGDWAGVRYAVNGGYNGLELFMVFVNNLLRIPEPPTHTVTTLMIKAALKEQPNHVCRAVADLDEGCTVEFTGQVTPHWAQVIVKTGHTQKLKNITGKNLKGWLLREDLYTVQS